MLAASRTATEATAAARTNSAPAMTAMTYKGYTATVEYDPDAGIFHGEVADTRDVITFQGKSVAEAKQVLAESIEDYLAFREELRK
ncbi:type II toxin-antitoxin system HicB family antitoxin [Rhodopseudomonas palustris]|uniref:Type II toxin-antitoxin system HicB family antitoxin n=1 Tax=Rhodopseudomonas palustris TaxID=1076 RepID=A0AAX3E551_RHOPL|nr:type II toxin-antitoxin system HicB family antitoxin [Rhodopseudomonas palustris]UYO41490.1 type II toxin-antitoxin system HicB family antitoxin [Rhodopseudomonas palustris]